MKKLFAVTVFFALLTSLSFADISISGLVSLGATLAKGTLVNDDDVRASMNYVCGTLEADGQDDDNTFGGSVKIKTETGINYVQFSASAWWQPVTQLKLRLGGIDDFALTEIVGWGYHANDSENLVLSALGNYAGYNFPNTTGFYAGTGSSWTGVTLSLSPMYGLDINLEFPLSKGNPFTLNDMDIKPPALDVYQYSSMQAIYTVYGIGRFSVAFTGGGDGKLRLINDTDPPASYITPTFLDGYTVNSSTVYASFLWTTLDFVNFNIGVTYSLPVEFDYGGSKTSYFPPMTAGAGLSIGTDQIGVKTRIAATFLGGSVNVDNVSMKEPLRLGFGILPYYKLGPCMLYLNASISYTQDYEQKKGTSISEVSSALGWFINPYMTVPVGYGTFYAGLRLESDGLKYGRNSGNIGKNNFVVQPDGKPIIEWAVPIGMQFMF